jgi:hypothetical protein
MTIAICLKVNDGIVLAADSAATLFDEKGAPTKVYNNANKICNLAKGHPIGFLTWGSGSIGRASTTTLAKDFRANLQLEPDYTIERVAKKADEFFRNLHTSEYKSAPGPELGFVVSGYSAHADEPETWRSGIPSSTGPQLVHAADVVSVNWWGQAEAVARLLLGHGTGLATALAELGTDPDVIKKAIPKIQAALSATFLHPAMPIQDAIDFAEFLAKLQTDWARFSFGHATVGGPVELAAITKHEGFKWIKRKHYYSPLNQSQ